MRTVATEKNILPDTPDSLALDKYSGPEITEYNDDPSGTSSKDPDKDTEQLEVAKSETTQQADPHSPSELSEIRGPSLKTVQEPTGKNKQDEPDSLGSEPSDNENSNQSNNTDAEKSPVVAKPSFRINNFDIRLNGSDLIEIQIEFVNKNNEAQVTANPLASIIVDTRSTDQSYVYQALLEAKTTIQNSNDSKAQPESENILDNRPFTDLLQGIGNLASIKNFSFQNATLDFSDSSKELRGLFINSCLGIPESENSVAPPLKNTTIVGLTAGAIRGDIINSTIRTCDIRYGDINANADSDSVIKEISAIGSTVHGHFDCKFSGDFRNAILGTEDFPLTGKAFEVTEGKFLADKDYISNFFFFSNDQKLLLNGQEVELPVEKLQKVDFKFIEQNHPNSPPAVRTDQQFADFINGRKDLQSFNELTGARVLGLKNWQDFMSINLELLDRSPSYDPAVDVSYNLWLDKFKDEPESAHFPALKVDRVLHALNWISREGFEGASEDVKRLRKLLFINKEEQ